MPEVLLGEQVSHGAIQFMVYEELKSLTAGATEYAKDTGRSSLSAAQISFMGAASKLAASVVTYPSQVEGVQGPLHKCYIVFKDIWSWVHVACAYTSCLQALLKMKCSTRAIALVCMTYMPCTYHRSRVSCHGVHPCMQVVRSRLQQRQAHNRAVQYRDGFATLRLILRREGAAGLYKGLVPNVLRVMPQAAITFLVYEQIMRLLETQVVQRWTAQ